MQRSDQTRPGGRVSGTGGRAPGTAGDHAARAGASATGRGQDRLVGIVILAVGAFLFWQTFSFKTVEWEALGLAFWPRVVLGLLGVIGVYLVVRGSLDDGPFVGVEPKAFLVLAGALAYVLSIDILGYLVATPLYIFIFHLTLGGISTKRLIEAALLAAAGTGLIYYVFEDALWVQFPEGILFVEEL